MSKDLCMQGEQFFDEYILIAPGSDYGRAMWSDIDLLDNGTILDNALKQTHRILSLLHHLHFSFTINRQVQLPFQQIWKPLYSMEAIRMESSKRYCVVYTDVSAARTDLKYLEKLKQIKNITMVLVMVNTMVRRDSLIKKRLPYFSMVFSFDKKDCKEYRFIYHPTHYSKVKMGNAEVASTDAFYVGVSKGRVALLAHIYRLLSASGAKVEFYISKVEKKDKYQKGIHYNKWLSYAEVLENIRNSNCIVEVMDGKQEGVTLRTMEAICYNKKLLTNNQFMKQSKYYKSGNIQVFVKPEDINVDFVKDRSTIDYGYNGEFSPIRLLEHINSEVRSRE